MFHVILTEPAEVTGLKGIGNNCIIRNENTNLTCSVNGVPAPTIEWFRSGGNDRETITNDVDVDKFTVMGNILIINNVNNDDAGLYGCAATNTVDGMERNSTMIDTFAVCGESVFTNESKLGKLK